MSMSRYNGFNTIGRRIVENGTVKFNTTPTKICKKALRVNNIGYLDRHLRGGN